MSEPVENLGSRAATGMVLMASTTVFSRVTSFLTQLVLAWLLAPNDFGQIGLVYTITSFASQLTNPGIDDVLLQKQRRIRRWVTPAFWMSLSCGFCGALVMASAGAVVVTIASHHGNAAYGNPNLFWMILILAAGAPLNAASLICTVILRSELRFARLAAINLGEIVTQQSLMILFASLGFGAYAFVIPMPLVAAVRTLILWLMVRPPVKMHLGIMRWGSLIGSTGWVFGQRLLATATLQGDYITLGAMYASSTIVGEYFFAFMLATQVLRVLGENVTAVLLPALNVLQDQPERMMQAGRRAAGTVAAVVAPIATLQILLAGPVVRLLFAAKWHPSIPLIQLLSLGPLAYAAAWPVGAMLVAKGRFRASFFLWLACAVTFFSLVVPLSWKWQAVGTAAGVCTWAWLTTIYYGICVYRSPRGALVMLEALARPLGAVAAVAAPAGLIVWLLPQRPIADAAAVATVTPLVLGGYYLVLRRLDPQAVQTLTRYIIDAGGKVLRLLQRVYRRPTVLTA